MAINIILLIALFISLYFNFRLSKHRKTIARMYKDIKLENEILKTKVTQLKRTISIIKS